MAAKLIQTAQPLTNCATPSDFVDIFTNLSSEYEAFLCILYVFNSPCCKSSGDRGSLDRGWLVVFVVSSICACTTSEFSGASSTGNTKETYHETREKEPFTTSCPLTTSESKNVVKLNLIFQIRNPEIRGLHIHNSAPPGVASMICGSMSFQNCSKGS